MSAGTGRDRLPQHLAHKYAGNGQARVAPSQELVEAALRDGKYREITEVTDPDGDTQPIGSEDEARHVKNAPHDQGVAHVHAIPHEQRAYNPMAAAARPRGKYMCEKSAGGCGHRRAAEPDTLCLDCMARQTAGRQAALDHRRWGEDNTDVRNWMVDHGYAPQRSPREARDRSRSVAASARLQEQLANRERETEQLAERQRPRRQ